MRTEAGKTNSRTDPGLSQTKTTTSRRTPAISLNPTFTKAETNKSITVASTVSHTETDALRKTKGTNVNPSRTNADPLKNISGIAKDRVKPDQPRISNTIAKTATIVHPPENGRPASGKSNVSKNL